MAEDLHNPLNNPGADPVGQELTPRAEPAEVSDELSEFLDDVFESEPRDSLPESTPEPSRHEPATPAAASSTPGGEVLPPSSSDAPDDEPPPVPTTTEPTQDDLQRQVLKNLNVQLEKMAQPTPEPEPQAEPITPDMMLRHYQPRIQEYVEAGWLDEEYVALYPKQAALTVHMWDTGSQLQQGVQQAQEFTQGEEARRRVESASQQLNSAIDEVAARGEGFSALSADEVKQGFREFLINDVNPTLSQVTPDFLARQFYAYNHELILNTINSGRGATDGQAEPLPAQGEPTPAQLAQQEGSSSRSTPSTPEQPDFVDLLQGTTAARWYE